MEADAIPLRLVSTDGGEHSSRYSTEHVFKDGNTNVYSSEKKDEVVVVAQPVNAMQLFSAEEVAMQNPPSHFDSPVRTAMAFVSDTLPASEDFEVYKRDYSLEQYQELVRRSNWPADKPRPVAFFHLSGPDDVCKVKVEPPVRGRYLAVKFLSVYGGNVDCAAVTLRGRLVSSPWASPLALLCILGSLMLPAPSPAVQHDRATPLRGPPRPRSKLRGVGLKVFASMLSAISPEDSAMARFTLTRVNSQLKGMQPGAMLADWAPPPMEEEDEAPVDRASLVVSSAQPGYGGDKSIDDEGDATSWKCKAGTGAAQWTVRLQKPTTVQRVRVVFADRLAPAAVMVFLASEEGGEGAGSDVAALNFVPVAARTVTQPDEVYVNIPSRARVAARAVRLDLAGHHSSNREKMVGVSSVQLLQPAEDKATSPRECLATIERWAARVLRASSDPETRAEAMTVLMRLSIASGTLASQLQLADALLSSGGDAADTLPDGAAQDAAGYLTSLGRDALEREQNLLAHEIQFTPRRGRAPVEGACFDEGAASGGVKVLDGGDSVRSVSGNNQHCLVNVGFSSSSCSWAAWEFKLEEDTSSQTTCFGAAIKPVQNSSYERSKELWMYRAYSGQVYSLGSTRSLRKRKVHKGNTIRFELLWSDCTIRASVEGEDQGVVFEVEEGQTVYPAVAFYGSNRSVSLLSVESDRETSVMPLSELPLLAHSVGHGEMGVGGKLGYGPKPGEADPGVRLGGQPMRAAISLHPPTGSQGESPVKEDADLPPDEGCAFAEYSLAGEFAQFSARCAINGSADAAMLASHGVLAYFEVWVDGLRRWRSPAHTQPEVESSVTLNVSRARRLRLVTRCAGCNYSAHCVWMGTSLVPATLYSHWFDRMLGDTPGAVHGLVHSLPAAKAALSGPQPSLAFISRMLGLSSALASTHTRITRDAGTQFVPAGSDDIWAPFPLESAHSLEASPRTLAVLVRLLEKLAKRAREGGEGGNASPTNDALCASLELVGANLRRLAVSCVDPADAGFDSSPRLAKTEEQKEPDPAGAGAVTTADEGVGTAGGGEEASDVFSRERLYQILQDMVQPQGDVGRGIPSRARALAGEVLHVGASLLVPDPDVRASALREAAVHSRVVELQLRWPVVAATSDEDPRLERAALTVQGAALRHGWRATVLGSWMALLYVVVEVPEEGREDGSAVHFLESEMPEAMAQAGIEGFHASTGLAEPLVSVRVEHDHDVDRGARLTREPGVGCVRLFVEEETSFDAVCEGIRGFTKLCQQQQPQQKQEQQ